MDMTGIKAKICLKAIAYDSEGNETDRYENPDDLATEQFATIMIPGMLDGTSTATDVTGIARAMPPFVFCTGMYINAGTGTTPAAFTDYALTTTGSAYNANGSYCQAGVVGAILSNTFTITAGITNSSGSAITYNEAGISVVAYNTVYYVQYKFLIAHDVFSSSLTVPNGGVLAIIYTITFT
jgi:hypothetical protein